MSDSLQDQVLALLERAEFFPRSRRELMRRIIEDPGKTVPTLVRIASNGLGNRVEVAAEVMRSAVMTTRDPALATFIHKSVRRRGAHFRA